MGRTNRPARTAISLATGLSMIPTDRETDDTRIDPTFRIGLHWGRGMDWGWISADYYSTFGTDIETVQDKIDISVGYRFTDDWAGLLSAEAGLGIESDFYAKISPALIYNVNDYVSLRATYTQAMTGDKGGGLGVQAWFTF